MKEVKNPKKPLIFYYGVILLVVILLNLIAGPMLMQHQVKDVDYGTFLSMIADKTSEKSKLTTAKLFLPTNPTRPHTRPVKWMTRS